MQPIRWEGNQVNEVDGTRVQHLGGLSAMFGDDQRCVTTLRWAAAQVDRLDAPHRVGGSFPTGDPSLTKSVWRTGWFFGLAYNLK